MRLERHGTQGTTMVEHELLTADGILIIRPKSSLEATDFQRIAQEVDPYLEANGKLHGILIDAESFPGWKNLAALMAHLRFVRGHHRKIQRIAALSDSTVLTLAPAIASHFVQAEVRHFARTQRDEALNWLRTGS